MVLRVRAESRRHSSRGFPLELSLKAFRWNCRSGSMRSFTLRLLVTVQSALLLAGDIWLIQEGFHNQYLQAWIQDSTGLSWVWVLSAVVLSVAISTVGISLWIFVQPEAGPAPLAGATIRIPLGPATTAVTPATVETPTPPPALSDSSIRIQTSAPETVEEHLGFPLAVGGDVAVSPPKGPGETPRSPVPQLVVPSAIKKPPSQLVDFLTTKRKFVIVEPPKKEKKA